MVATDMKNELLEVAKDCLARGPGFAQEYVVLREVAEKLRLIDDLEAQQAMLTSWHDLFREGVLSWGYDIDNPTVPFFHLSKRQN
jgi:hypothetical protein